MKWESWKVKKSKIGSSQTFEISQLAQKNRATAMKLILEN